MRRDKHPYDPWWNDDHESKARRARARYPAKEREHFTKTRMGPAKKYCNRNYDPQWSWYFEMRENAI